MIIDTLENYKLYSNLDKKISVAFDYIRSTDFLSMNTGKYEIQKEIIFAIISDYHTKNSSQCKLEAHRRYIDLQYVVQGFELFGYTPLKNQKPVCEYDDKNDLIFYQGEPSFTLLEKGMFAILFPKDLHMPGTGQNPSPVRKVVVKIRI